MEESYRRQNILVINTLYPSTKLTNIVVKCSFCVIFVYAFLFLSHISQ